MAAGTAAITVGETIYQAQPGDIIYTPAGAIHDITAITSQDDLEVFWLSWSLPGGANGQHLHQTPDDAARHPVPGPKQATA